MMRVEFVHFNILYLAGVFLTLLVLLYVYRIKSKKQTAILVPFLQDLKLAEKKAKLWKSKKTLVYLKWVSFVLTVVLLSVALARPQNISSKNKITKNGVDILIALDVSESMLSEDLKPNRIESAKKYIDEFVSKLKTDRVGLEIFAGKPFTQSPMSFDYNVIRYYLSEISTDNIDQRRGGLNGTAIGDAILSAVNRFKNSKDRTKVLILLTDGEANVGVDPVFAAEHARANGLKIYTIGLGKKEGAPMPIGMRNGRKIYARNPDGSLYKSIFDEQSLKDIAQVSGGQYFWAGSNDALEKTFNTISKLEKKEYKAEVAIKKEDIFWPWLMAGFIFAILLISLIILSCGINLINILSIREVLKRLKS